MAKDKITDYSATNSDNTDIGGIGILGTNTISNFDNAVREVMTHLAEINAGTYPLADTFSVGDAADLTKRVRLDAGNVTAGQTRVLTMPDQNVTVTADAADLLAQTLSTTQKNKTVKVNNAGTAYVFQRNPFYDPYEYGCVGDGSTNDTTNLAACITAADADDGIGGAVRGRGVTVIPNGFFATNGVTLSNDGSRIMGLGGRLQTRIGGQNLLTVAASSCVVEGLTLYDPFLIGAGTNSVLQHTAGSDCTFRKLDIIGGYYGIRGQGSSPANAGDSLYIDCKVRNCYGSFVYLQNYIGMWCIRGKFDGSWPVQTPVAANEKGAWVATTAYVVGDVVTKSGYAYQCKTAGTSGSTGPVVTIKGTDITDGSVTWLMHRVTNSAGLEIDGDSFINLFINCDFTGGHLYSVWLRHTTGTYAPQTTYFGMACEFGSPFYYGLVIDAAEYVVLTDMIIDGGITASSLGVVGTTCQTLKITGCLIHGFDTGVQITNGMTDTNVVNSTIIGNTNYGVRVVANSNDFRIQDNNLGTGTWGANGIAFSVATGTSDRYRVKDNSTYGSPDGVDGGSGFKKTVSGNF